MPSASGEDGLFLKIWGARGSFPSSPDDPSIYGARTCCVEVRAGPTRMIFDAGSGIVALGTEMLAQSGRVVDLFLSHAHYDHIMGLPYFAPFYDSSFHIRIHAGHMQDGQSCQDLVDSYMSPPFHPVTPKIFKAKVEYVTFRPGDMLRPSPSIAISTLALHHPNGAVGYRVEHGGRAIVYATDNEHDPRSSDPALLRFIHGAGILIYDTAFTDAEMPHYRGFGHSSVEEGIRLCQQADVDRLVLFHHSHKRSDSELASIEARAKADFPGAVAARVGMELALPADPARLPLAKGP